MMTDSIVFNIGVFIVIGAALIGMVFVDFIMSYLQSDKDPWRIYITQGQALFQIVVLFSVSYLAYAFGHFIGSSLPYSGIDEPFVVGGVFAILASVIARSYTMLHFHKVNQNK